MDALTVSIVLLAAGLAFFYFGKNGGIIPKIVFPIAFLAIIALNQLTGTEIVMLTAAAIFTFFGFPKSMPAEKKIPGYAGGQGFKEEMPEEEFPQEEELNEEGLPEEETEEGAEKETEDDSEEELPEEEPKQLHSKKARKQGY